MAERADTPRVRFSDELKALAEKVITTDLDDATVAELAQQVESLRQGLDGPTRLRWWQHEDGGDRRFRHVSPFRHGENPAAPGLVLEPLHHPDRKPGVRGRVKVHSMYEGPPSTVHGGVVAGLLDELLGAVQSQIVQTRPALTARLTVRYRKRTPIDTDLVLDGWVDSDRGRRLEVRGECRAGDVVTAEAHGLFIRI